MKVKVPERVFFMLISACTAVWADDPKAAIQQKLQSEYTLTQATAAEDDIVTAGSVIVLKKGEVIMASTTTPNLYQNFYKDGKITQNSFGKIDKGLAKFSHRMGSTASTNNRTYVAGEKMWLTKIEVKDDGVVMSVLTDAVNDVRYRASVKFGWAKGVIPPVDQVDKEVAEVFSVQAADDSKGQQQTAQAGQSGTQTAAAAAPAAAAPSQKAVEAPPPPIAPPPPPTDAPTQTIAMGQTTDQVVGILGQPTKMIKLGAKQIYVYKDMKITFKDGKVSDVQ